MKNKKVIAAKELAAATASLAFIAFGVMLVSGCSKYAPPAGSGAFTEEQAWSQQPGEIHLIADPVTRCQYIGWKYGAAGGFTLRVDRNGKPMCGDPR